ncbi:MAG: DUF5074 domain-containing protein [Bacteroidota bacterium]
MMNPSRLTPALLALLLLLLPGCELFGDDNDPEPITTGVYVANQGNFSDGNGSVTVYDPATESAAPLLADIGSIIQSLFLTEDRLFVMANTGARVEIVELETGARTSAVEGLVSPRYMAQVDADKAYVTNLFKENFAGGIVDVVNLQTGTVTSTFDVGDNPEGVAVVGDRAYVANHGFGAGSSVSVIDTDTDTVIETVDVDCAGPRFVMAGDIQDDVFVICTGRTLFDADFNPVGEVPGALRILDAQTGAVIDRLDLDTQLGASGPGQDAYWAQAANELYVVQGPTTVLRFDTRTGALVGTLELPGDPIGAVAYDAQAERLYVGRVASFTESGSVTIHDRDGVQVGSFVAGIAPTFIDFRVEDR